MDIFKIRSLTASSLGVAKPRTGQTDKLRQIAMIFPGSSPFHENDDLLWPFAF
jgi:hypothetical protein